MKSNRCEITLTRNGIFLALLLHCNDRTACSCLYDAIFKSIQARAISCRFRFVTVTYKRAHIAPLSAIPSLKTRHLAQVAYHLDFLKNGFQSLLRIVFETIHKVYIPIRNSANAQEGVGFLSYSYYYE